MNILFVVNSLSEVAGANVNIVRTLTRILRKKNCSVYVLAKSDCRRPISKLITTEFDGAYFLPSDRFEIIPNLYNVVKTDNKKLKEIIWLVNHPGIFWKAIDIKLGNAYWTRKEYARNIKKICEKKDIDVVIGVTAPYEIARAVSNSKIKAIKTIYQLDPYTNNYTFSSKGKEKRKLIERKTIEKLDVLFVPDFIRKDLFDSGVCSECEKIVQANIPGIIVDKIMQENINMTEKQIDDYVNIVFAGKLYEKIRNPDSLLTLMDYLPNNYRLHILGSGCEEQILNAKKELGEKLVYYGLVSKKEADYYVNNADVLVNIDNTIKNQMPSKIVDYICQGKKIINICIDRDCLASKLLSNYSNGINVCVTEKNPVENACLIKEFIEKNIRKPTAEDIVELYKEYTDLYVADIFLERILHFQDKCNIPNKNV